MPHPLLGPVLRDGHGLLLYEDDVLSAVEALTGLPAAEADKLRRRPARGGDDPSGRGGGGDAG